MLNGSVNFLKIDSFVSLNFQSVLDERHVGLSTFLTCPFAEMWAFSRSVLTEGEWR